MSEQSLVDPGYHDEGALGHVLTHTCPRKPRTTVPLQLSHFVTRAVEDGGQVDMLCMADTADLGQFPGVAVGEVCKKGSAGVPPDVTCLERRARSREVGRATVERRLA